MLHMFGVRILIFIECQNGAIRLQGGTNSLEGRVEVCNENRWGSVCDDAWGTIDAQVACRQLGFDTTGTYLHTYLCSVPLFCGERGERDERKMRERERE